MPKRQVRRPNGKCAVCNHSERSRIELLRAQGAAVRAIGSKFGLNFYAVHRHWTFHVSEERKASLALGPVTAAALAAQVAEESTSVIDHLRAVRAGLYALYDSAVSAGDRTGGALLAGRLHENLGKMAQLTGQLAQSPLVTHQHLHLSLAESPEIAAFVEQISRILEPFPEARLAVFRAVQGLDQQQVGAAGLVSVPTPQLEQQDVEDAIE